MAVKRKTKTEEPTLTINEEQEWGEEKIQKYRNMKRKLIEVIAKKNEFQAALEKANKRIDVLEKKVRQQQAAIRKHNKKDQEDDAMDVSQDDATTAMEEDITDVPLEDDEQEDEEEDEERDQLDEDEEPPVPKKSRLTKRKRVAIPRDADGCVVLPFQVASLNILSVGEVDTERALYHNERYIFPIGYTVERTYMSMVDPEAQTTYTGRIEDGGDSPLFTLSAADAPDTELSARTATGVWALVIKKANEVRNRESSNAISGPEYYGLSNPVVIEMIEELPGVDKCTRYKRRN